MNLLIAIMGDTFARVTEVMERSEAIEKTELIFDFIWVIDMQEMFQNSKYVLIVEQNSSNKGPPNSLEGRFSKLQTFIQNQLSSLE